MFDLNLSNLCQKRDGVESRSISAENPNGEPGKGAICNPDWTKSQEELGVSWAARELGQGWKVRPCLIIQPGETVTLMDQEGPGVIRHMWFTFAEQFYRDIIIRIYWDGQDEPSVLCPLGDFLCNSWNQRQDIMAQPINVNPHGGMNIYFPMPFRKHCRITVENRNPNVLHGFFYTINYTLEKVAEDNLYFHAYWRRENPLQYGTEYLVVDDIEGQGQFVGLFMAWQQNNKGWWGEGEIKMFLDEDGKFPTICGTGTEDYFGGAWCFAKRDYTAPYLGFLQVEGKSEDVGCRMVMYRFHVQDPVFFQKKLKVRMQALGWRDQGRFLPLQDDIASVAYWYQTLPHKPFPAMPDRNYLEVI